jgi:hypothetical protein
MVREIEIILRLWIYQDIMNIKETLNIVKLQELSGNSDKKRIQCHLFNEFKNTKELCSMHHIQFLK